jgi:hypothetical protein
MLLRNSAGLALGLFLFSFATGMAEAQAPLKDPKVVELSKRKWKVIDGFRSAKFGMNEKQVRRAITKDFKISKSKVQREVHPTAKTTTLTLSVQNLIEQGGPANINYILGYKSKRLIHIDITWGINESKGVLSKDIVNVANLLQTHFIKKRYQEGDIVNGRLNDAILIKFRGSDKNGRMILLRLFSKKAKKGEDKKESAKALALSLTYIQQPKNPDVFKAK